MKYKLKTFLSITLIALAFSSCTQVKTAELSNAQELKTAVSVRLAWLHQAQFAGFYMAKEHGMYSAAGLDVTLNEYQAELDQPKELLDGKVQFSVMSPVEFLSEFGKGSPLRAVAVIYQKSPYAFASLKSKNIKTPADLLGKILGKKGGNNEATVTYLSLLSRYNIDKSKVTLKDINFDMDEGQDLLKNRADVIDLYRTDQTYLLDKQGIQYDLLYPEKFGFERYGDVLVTTETMINTKPDVVHKFVQATLKGWNAAFEDPNITTEAVLKYARGEYNNEEREEYILAKSQLLIIPTGGEPIGNMKFVTWNSMAQAMESAGLLAQDADIDDAYTTKFLK